MDYKGATDNRPLKVFDALLFGLCYVKGSHTELLNGCGSQDFLIFLLIQFHKFSCVGRAIKHTFKDGLPIVLRVRGGDRSVVRTAKQVKPAAAARWPSVSIVT